MVRRGNCSNVKIWTLPLRDLVGIHATGTPGWIVGVWHLQQVVSFIPAAQGGLTGPLKAKDGQGCKEHS